MKITVIIPSYNGALFIEDCIDSIEKQTLLPEKIIVVDDCSSDHTIEVVRAGLGDRKIPLQLVELAQNSGGPSKPINVGVGLASTEYIMVLDQDDVLLPNALQHLVSSLEECPSAQVAIQFASYHGFGSTVSPIQKGGIIDEIMGYEKRSGGYYIIPKFGAIELLFDFGNFAVGYPGFVFRRFAWQLKGGVDENLRIAGDLDFLGWLSCMGDVVIVPEVGYERREHCNNASNQSSALSFFEMANVYSRLAILCRDDISYSTYLKAINNVRGIAYWFRKGHLFDKAKKLHVCLGLLGVSRRELITLRCKLVAELVYSRFFRNPPLHSNFTRKRLKLTSRQNSSQFDE